MNAHTFKLRYVKDVRQHASETITVVNNHIVSAARYRRLCVNLFPIILKPTISILKRKTFPYAIDIQIADSGFTAANQRPAYRKFHDFIHTHTAYTAATTGVSHNSRARKPFTPFTKSTISCVFLTNCRVISAFSANDRSNFSCSVKWFCIVVSSPSIRSCARLSSMIQHPSIQKINTTFTFVEGELHICAPYT